MLSISHQHNTVPKPEQNFRDYALPNRYHPQFPFKTWKDFVQDEESRAFYRKLFKI